MPTDSQFKGPGGVKLDHLIIGVIPQAKLTIDNRIHREDVYVMKNQNKNLLSKTAIQALQLLKTTSSVYAVEPATNFRNEFPAPFKGLGLLQEPYRIRLRQDATPVCLYTPRRVPHPLLPKVKKQLQEMIQSEVISQVNEATEWCSGMVVVPKSSGDLRICVDLTPLNKAVLREVHPMASVDENLAKIKGSQFFTKLDANSGFWQIPLHSESRLLTTFITPFGRFCFNRLPFGISSAPEIFQRQMSRILEDLDGVVCHMDDILIHAATLEVHDNRVRAVLRRLQDARVTLNQKCEFARKRITFLGHIVSADGIEVDPKKTQAIQDFPAPTTVTELQRFNGMVNQLAKFLPNLAQVNEPLRQLLRKDTSWVWDAPQKTAFQEIKTMLMSTNVLAHYNPKSPSTIAADASQYGIGAVLLQEDSHGHRRPISFASRSLSDTEKNYAVIEKEALAATWACEKFRDYVLGTKFTLETDHRPLVPLLSTTNLSKLPARILRFRLRLMRYSPELKYIQGVHHQMADALSRAPVEKPSKDDEILIEEAEEFKDSVACHLPASDQRLREILEAQINDAVCSQIRTYVKDGWPSVMPNLPLLKPYWSNAHHLSINNDLLMFDDRLVIPQNMQLDILNKLHAGHLGMTKCKGRAYSSVWWPSITSQIEAMCRKCLTCVLHQDEKAEPLLALSPPTEIWERIGTDLFEFKKEHYVVIVDYGSRWLDFKKLNSTNSQAVIRALSEIFSTHGVPKIVISDNGPQFSSSEFKQFAVGWGVTHVTSSPRYPKANGEAERAVRTAKAILSKNSNPYLGLLAYRTAPIHNGETPSQPLMSRQLRTTVPVTPGKLSPEVPDHVSLRERKEKYKITYAQNHDKHHRVIQLPGLNPGDKVFVRDQGRQGNIQQLKNNPRSYAVAMEDGNVITRNRSALIHTDTTDEMPPLPVPEPPPTTPSPEPSTPSPTAPLNSIPKSLTPTKPPKPSSPKQDTVIVQRKSNRVTKPNKQPDMVYYN